MDIDHSARVVLWYTDVFQKTCHDDKLDAIFTARIEHRLCVGIRLGVLRLQYYLCFDASFASDVDATNFAAAADGKPKFDTFQQSFLLAVKQVLK